MAAFAALAAQVADIATVALAEAVQNNWYTDLAEAIVAADIVDMGSVVVASFIPLSTLHNTLSIQCVYVVQRCP